MNLNMFGSFAIAVCASFVVAIDAWSEAFHAGYVAVALAVLLLIHMLRFPRLVVARETVIYGAFVGYMVLQLAWTPDRGLASNTLFPAFNVLAVQVLFCSLLAMHDVRSVLTGTLAGVVAGSVVYTATSGFPLRYPPDFPYNAVASMYLFAFLVALLLAALARRRLAPVAVAVLAGMLVVATTSIKTNLGILLGAIAGALAHFGYVWRQFWRHSFLVFVLAGSAAFAVVTSPVALEAISRGAHRVELGVKMLEAREGLAGYGAFEKRTTWQREGLRGWAANPVFGHGVEAFRARYGITSHSSHIDLLYNSGLVGAVLFYGMLASVLLRLRRSRAVAPDGLRLVVLGGVLCYTIMSFAGTVHYMLSLGAFVALSAGLLRRA